MTDTPHFTAMGAYRAVYGARVGEGVSGCWMYAPETAERAINNSAEFVVDGYINFDTLADHINAAIAEAVKAEREACAELCEERFGPNGTYEARITRPDGSEAKIVKASYAVDHGQWVPQCAAKEIRERGAK